MDLIWDLGGNSEPSKLSTRMTAPGPAISESWRCISAGSSESASIASRVSVVPNVRPRSEATVCRSRLTVTSAVSF